ncbi:hypothetical protein Pmani_009527 [Petrolisthes manimaculis]|uniref:Ferric-chelate reductase 1 n=1 Tax=Petrolisthes manimaculis TaxID=1843537 RepID=A0AAE1Q3B9_9EUCA|nr:hypothetical protein Pmani_009527 [Petrolisthes manimaculis]
MAGVARVLAAVVVGMCVSVGVHAFSQGAPDTTCGNITPVHGTTFQTTPAPYTVTPGAARVIAGEKMLVTLEAAAGESFMGFLLQARTADTDQVTGTFFTTDHKYLNCDNGMNNAVTHRGPAAKSKVTLMWEPKSDFTGDVVFKGTFVKERMVFWVGVTSEKVTVAKREASQPPPAPTTTTTPAPTTPAPTTQSPSVSSEPNAVNAGDTVISVVDAPSAVAENGINVASTADNSDFTPTIVEEFSLSSPPSPTVVSPPSLSTTSSPSPTITSSTQSSPSSPVQSETTAKPNGSTTRRKFGILNRLRTTAAPTTSTTTTTTPAYRVPDEDLTPETLSLQNDLINIYDECGRSKGCFGAPSGCVDNKNCKMMVTYTKASSGFRFEIMGPASSGYVAAGLSEDEKMGDDSVMVCRNLDGVMDVVMAHNTGNSNQLLTDSKSRSFLSDVRTLLLDNKIYCKFVRRANTEIMNTYYDLENNRYHIMMARGSASKSSLSYHVERTVSSGSVSAQKFESVVAVSDLFRTLHACFMVGAWICAASCGIIIARYYKKTWLKSRCCGIDQWFHLHRLFMGLTWGLTMAGLGLIVYYIGGWTSIDPKVNPHAILGIISTGLCFIQPFMALCRCGPDHKRRPVFNWLHWLVGNCAQILGITAIFFGLELVGAPEWTTFILIIFIAFHCMVHLILSIGQCVSDSKAENGNNVYPMKEVNGSRNPLHPTQKRMDAPGGGFRKAMLAFYFFINWLITAILLLIIIVKEEDLKRWGVIFWEEDA